MLYPIKRWLCYLQRSRVLKGKKWWSLSVNWILACAVFLPLLPPTPRMEHSWPVWSTPSTQLNVSYHKLFLHLFDTQEWWCLFATWVPATTKENFSGIDPYVTSSHSEGSYVGSSLMHFHMMLQFCMMLQFKYKAMPYICSAISPFVWATDGFFF